MNKLCKLWLTQEKQLIVGLEGEEFKEADEKCQQRALGLASNSKPVMDLLVGLLEKRLADIDKDLTSQDMMDSTKTDVQALFRYVSRIRLKKELLWVRSQLIDN